MVAVNAVVSIIDVIDVQIHGFQRGQTLTMYGSMPFLWEHPITWPEVMS